MKWLLLLAVLGACRDGGASSHVTVTAYGGDRTEANALVVAHQLNGELTDATQTDATGRAVLSVDTDSLLSVVFPSNVSGADRFTIATTVPPTDGSELEIHGPMPTLPPPLIVGVLNLDGPALDTAREFQVTLGCVTVVVPSLPATIDVSACNMGTDRNLDVLVRGYDNDGDLASWLVGYAAGRVAMTDGVAAFEVPEWLTTMPQVPINIDVVNQSSASWTLFSDTLPFTGTDVGRFYTGLTVDAVETIVTLQTDHGERITTRETQGVPTSIDFAESDFLAPLDSIPAAPSPSLPLTVIFDRADLGADALRVRASWDSNRVTWEAVLPTTATSIALPLIDDSILAGVQPSDTLDSLFLEHIDIPDLDGFDAFRAAGLHVGDGAVPTGEVRVSQSFGSP